MTALKTDMYELSMMDTWLRQGMLGTPATFEVFARKLAPGYRYGVVGGIGRILDELMNFRFEDTELEWLRGTGLVSMELLHWLESYRFRGELKSYRDGELYFPGSPVVQVNGTLADVVLETLILSIVNFDSAVATKAARIVAEAQGAPVIEMGSRRTHDDAAVAAARAAYISGFAATSNLEAGMRYGVPVKGTAAHAFTLSFGGSVGEESFAKWRLDDMSELKAFCAQVDAHGRDTTLLVDTFDIERGIRNAVKAAGTSLGAIRIDSGDLALEATKARKLLDSLGAYGTRIIVTSDLDEHVIKDLRIAGAPIDGYGVGTKLVSVPPPGFVYKLVEVDGRPVEKASKDKVSVGGRKTAVRLYDGDHQVMAEVTGGDRVADSYTSRHPRELQERMMFRGFRTQYGHLQSDVIVSRAYHERVVDELPKNERAVWHGDHGPFITTAHRKDV